MARQDAARSGPWWVATSTPSGATGQAAGDGVSRVSEGLGDLAERARQRAGAAALCGWLLLAEPGPDVAQHLRDIEALAPLGDPSLAVDFERILLRQVAPYESVFRSPEGQRGGAVAAQVADFYDEFDLREHLDGRWRIGGPDHLGLELRMHSHLIALEAAAWEAERPDEAAAAVEAQRRFLAEHLAAWAEVALDALDEVADGSVYHVLFDAVRELMIREIDLLRPAPILDVTVIEDDERMPRHLGPGRLARHLLSPERSGLWLGTNEIATAAARLGFPWRPMDGRANLTPLVRAAVDAGELPELVEPWVAVATDATERYRRRAETQPGAELLWRLWERRAGATARLLDGVVAGLVNGETAGAEGEITVRITADDPDAAIDLLESAGYVVEMIDNSD